MQRLAPSSPSDSGLKESLIGLPLVVAAFTHGDSHEKNHSREIAAIVFERREKIIACKLARHPVQRQHGLAPYACLHAVIDKSK